MKRDADPGRTFEFQVLVTVILLALAGAALADFVRAPGWMPPADLAEASAGGDAGDASGVLIDPWIPH
ncbi:MAG: hypothetical protein JSS14_30410 [Proteobacteria bacterium]|nr:hypothetical protein [Pseudomonadota bacterium]